jgi:flagellar basal-body rod protein FlgB
VPKVAGPAGGNSRSLPLRRLPAAIPCRASRPASPRTGCEARLPAENRAPVHIIRDLPRLAQLLLDVGQRRSNVFENVFGIHEQALLLHGQRLGVLATNLANADTPGYKARDIDFSAVLSQTQGETELPLQVTHAAHITFNDGDGEVPSGELKYRNPYQASLDGNTVEMPVEQAAFSENNVRYQASLNFINLQISEMQLAIAGQ